MNKIDYGVCVVLPAHPQFRDVLAVSRRNDSTKWGLPGGKVELGETQQDAAVREIEEECGLRLRPHLLIPLYAAWCYGVDGRDFWVTTYLYTGGFDSHPVAEEGFFIEKMSMANLCDEKISPFALYNQKVLLHWVNHQ